MAGNTSEKASSMLLPRDEIEALLIFSNEEEECPRSVQPLRVLFAVGAENLFSDLSTDV